MEWVGQNKIGTPVLRMRCADEYGIDFEGVATMCWSEPTLVRTIRLLGFRCHVAFDIDAHGFRFGIGEQGDGLFETSRLLSGSVIRNLDGALLAGHHGLFGELRNGASARSTGLVNDQGGGSGIGVGEHTFHHGVVFGELTEVVGGFVECDFGFGLPKYCGQSGNQKREGE